MLRSKIEVRVDMRVDRLTPAAQLVMAVGISVALVLLLALVVLLISAVA